jgi:Soluble lytic murein transglycosylase and related regulatory proteins (some contain LysM/invasin domains)
MRVSRRLSLLFLFATALALTTAAFASATSDGEKGVTRASGRGAAIASTRPATAEETVPNKRCPLPGRFRTDFELASDKSGVPLSLLAAVAQEESNFEPNAVSHAGALGLLQVLPSTARELEINLNTPGANVLAGARDLRRMLDHFASPELALAAYNAGPTAVDKAGGPPTEETRAYVDEVMQRWQKLAGCS